MSWAFILFLVLAVLVVFFAPLVAQAVYSSTSPDDEERRKSRDSMAS
jgi:hypothetical protein